MSTHTLSELIRLVVVLAIVIYAAALATPKGRLPLALRGVLKILKRDGAAAQNVPAVEPVSAARRFFAFLLVLLAALLAIVKL